MKVVRSEENELEFDTGLKVYGTHSQDCCERNYLDFEQLPVGTELPDMTPAAFYDAMEIKEDGFSVRDSDGTPKWVQARSDQNGYYSHGVDLVIEDGEKRITPSRPGQESYEEMFIGEGYE